MEYQGVFVERIFKPAERHSLCLIKRDQGNILAELLLFFNLMIMFQNSNPIMPVCHLCLHAIAKGIHKLSDIPQHMIQPGSGSSYH